MALTRVVVPTDIFGGVLFALRQVQEWTVAANLALSAMTPVDDQQIAALALLDRAIHGHQNVQAVLKVVLDTNAEAYGSVTEGTG